MTTEQTHPNAQVEAFYLSMSTICPQEFKTLSFARMSTPLYLSSHTITTVYFFGKLLIIISLCGI